MVNNVLVWDEDKLADWMHDGYDYSRAAHLWNPGELEVLYLTNYQPTGSRPDFDKDDLPTNPCIKLLLDDYHNWMHNGDTAYIDLLGKDVWRERIGVVDVHNIKLQSGQASSTAYKAEFESWFVGNDEYDQYGPHNHAFLVALVACFPKIKIIICVGSEAREQMFDFATTTFVPQGIRVACLHHPQFVFEKIKYLSRGEAASLDETSYTIGRILLQSVGLDPSPLQGGFWMQNSLWNGSLIQDFFGGPTGYHVGERLSPEAKRQRGMLLAQMSVQQREWVEECILSMRLWKKARRTGILPNLDAVPWRFRPRMAQAIKYKRWWIEENKRIKAGQPGQRCLDAFTRRALHFKELAANKQVHSTWFKPGNMGGYNATRIGSGGRRAHQWTGDDRRAYSTGFKPHTKEDHFRRATLMQLNTPAEVMDAYDMCDCLYRLSDCVREEVWMPTKDELVQHIRQNKRFRDYLVEVDHTPKSWKISEFGVSCAAWMMNNMTASV